MMPNLFFPLFAAALLLLPAAYSDQPPFSCDSQHKSSFRFCNTSLSIPERTSELLSQLTLDEKISQLSSSAPAVSRLGIPAYEWWSEALHGVSGYGQGIRFDGTIRAATSFPQVILSAATFDSQLWYRIGQAIGEEARGIFNTGQAKGMSFWAPNINIFRDPRWGRGQETPGEDPLVAGEYAVAFVRGIQGDAYRGNVRTNHLQASACCKHFTAYDLEGWNGVTRFNFNAKVTKQDLSDTFQPPFKSCVEQGGASGIMCAYNRVNDIPNCADPHLLNDTARIGWGFNGYITSDCDSVSIMHDSFNYATSPEDAVADVLKAGMDLDCGTYLQKYTKSAIQQGKVSESDVNRALHNLFSVRMRLGLFDGPPNQLPFGNIGPDKVCTPEHRQLALDAAKNGIVLLKNSDKLLPLDKSSFTTLALIGPNAMNAYVLLGNYNGPPCKSEEIGVALERYAKKVVYEEGCDSVKCTLADIGKASEVASKADRVVLVMGLSQDIESEEKDRVDLTLPGMQESLVKAVAAASKKPVVLVLVCGGAVDVGFARDDPKVGSILWAGYPGEAGGEALAQILFGQHNPGGRLPVTWYPKEFAGVAMTDMRMRSELKKGYPGRSYRFYRGNPVFDFGYGLSYSEHSYQFLPSTPNTIRLAPTSSKANSTTRSLLVSEIGPRACNVKKLSARVRVKNTGSVAGWNSVLLFSRYGHGGGGQGLIKQLVAFKRVNLKAGEVVEVKFRLSPCEHLSSANEEGEMMIEQGHRYLMVGDKEHAINVIL